MRAVEYVPNGGYETSDEQPDHHDSTPNGLDRKRRRTRHRSRSKIGTGDRIDVRTVEHRCLSWLDGQVAECENTGYGPGLLVPAVEPDAQQDSAEGPPKAFLAHQSVP